MCTTDHVLIEDAQEIECAGGNCTQEQCCIRIVEVPGAFELDFDSDSDESCECMVIQVLIGRIYVALLCTNYFLETWY